MNIHHNKLICYFRIHNYITHGSAHHIWLVKIEIYGHGEIFEDEILDHIFRSKTWYIPSIEPEDFETM